jgi:aryl-alcohol dehydrogenase-like predicted oxidoreductase
MQERELGTNGPRVPVVGFGAWPIGGGLGEVDEQTSIKTVRKAIDNGMYLIDTAEGYQESEERIGKALSDGYRQKAFLATKVSKEFHADGIRKAMENSLRAMKTDYVDLYQVHRYAAEYPLQETMDTMRKLQEEGKARYIGVSNFRVEQLDAARQMCPIQSNQVNYNMFLRSIEQEMVPYCETRGIGLMVHSTLAKGLLTGKYAPGHEFAADDERSGFSQYTGKERDQYLRAAADLKFVAKARGVSLIQLAIAWALRLPGVATTLVGAKSPKQLKEPTAAGELNLSDSELRKLNEILDRHALPRLSPFAEQIV